MDVIVVGSLIDVSVFLPVIVFGFENEYRGISLAEYTSK